MSSGKLLRKADQMQRVNRREEGGVGWVVTMDWHSVHREKAINLVTSCY